MPRPRSDKEQAADTEAESQRLPLRFCGIFFLCTIAVLLLELVTPSRTVQIRSELAVDAGGDSSSPSSSSSAVKTEAVPKSLLETPAPTSSPPLAPEADSPPSPPSSFDPNKPSPSFKALAQPAKDFVLEVMKQAGHVNWNGNEKYRALPGTKQCPAFSSGKERIANCPDEDSYLERWIKHLKKSRKLPNRKKRWVVVDVGVNKGYAVAGILSTLGVTEVSRQQMGLDAFTHAYKENRVPGKLRLFLGGHCCDVLDGINATAQIATAKENVELFLYDGLSHNANFVRKFFLDNGMKKQQTRVRHAAVAERTGTVSFPDPGFFGSEFGSIEGVSAVKVHARNVPVPMVTLDSELPLEKVPYIDILLTDTEGSDFRVAAGSMNHILSGRVGLYLFELHGLRSKFPRLATFVRAIDTHYKCWFPTAALNESDPGVRKLIPFSGECFREEYNNVAGWHNVVCANKKERELVAALEELKDEPIKDEGLCSAATLRQNLPSEIFAKYGSEKHTAVWNWVIAGSGGRRRKR